MDQSSYITQDDFIRYRKKQNEDLHREFVRQHILIETSHEQLRVAISTLECTLSGRLDLLRNDLATLSGEVGNIKGEVVDLKGEVVDLKGEVVDLKGEVVDLKGEVVDLKGEVVDLKGEVAGLKGEVAGLKGEVAGLKGAVVDLKNDVGDIKAQLDQMRGRSFNELRFLPWHTIVSIGNHKDGAGFRKPAYFPPLISHLWNLTHPNNKEHLIYLLRFYDVEGYEHWGAVNFDYMDNVSGEPDDGSTAESDSSQLSLEIAVTSYPQRAVEELATCIGVDFQRIRDYYARQPEHRNQTQQQPNKRPPAEADPTKGEDVKRVKKSEQRLSPKSDIPIHPPRSVRPGKSVSTESPQTKIEWDVHSNERRWREFTDKLNRGSPTEEITSQEREERQAGEEKTSKKGSSR